ncbi:MAG: formate dehydrogenase accessory sulfurtransferase FdhD [Saprospiraceae bacterium]|nr:formate dehydrogenase accessory sulfurtransferase FdhD [Saprospiraceae bacterium]
MLQTGRKVDIRKWKTDSFESKEDVVAIEEPLQILVQNKAISITMRTPGDDKALALGFLFTEGILKSFSQVEDIIQTDENTVNVLLEESVLQQLPDLQKNFYTTSSCGVCGKSSIDKIYQISSFDIKSNNLKVEAKIFTHLQDRLLNVQTAFQETGGIHAAVLFDEQGNYFYHSEDVGRHNALDKLIGHVMIAGKLPLTKYILLLSGRSSFELIQKAAMAGISVVCAVGAPSSLAVDLAENVGITLLGFLKKTGYNVYSHPERILIDAS